MQWYARSLSPLCSPLPFQSAEAKLGIPARLDSDSVEGFGTGRRIQGLLFQTEGKFPPSPGPPCRGRVVIRIYNCWSGQYL